MDFRRFLLRENYQQTVEELISQLEALERRLSAAPRGNVPRLSRLGGELLNVSNHLWTALRRIPPEEYERHPPKWWERAFGALGIGRWLREKSHVGRGPERFAQPIDPQLEAIAALLDDMSSSSWAFYRDHVLEPSRAGVRYQHRHQRITNADPNDPNNYLVAADEAEEAGLENSSSVLRRMGSHSRQFLYSLRGTLDVQRTHFVSEPTKDVVLLLRAKGPVRQVLGVKHTGQIDIIQHANNIPNFFHVASEQLHTLYMMSPEEMGMPDHAERAAKMASDFVVALNREEVSFCNEFIDRYLAATHRVAEKLYGKNHGLTLSDYPVVRLRAFVRESTLVRGEN